MPVTPKPKLYTLNLNPDLKNALGVPSCPGFIGFEVQDSGSGSAVRRVSMCDSISFPDLILRHRGNIRQW